MSSILDSLLKYAMLYLCAERIVVVTCDIPEQSPLGYVKLFTNFYTLLSGEYVRERFHYREDLS